MATPGQDGDIKRISLDLHRSQRDWLKIYSLRAGLTTSIVLRALIYLLETKVDLQDELLDIIFLAEDEDLDEEEGVTDAQG